MCPLSPEGQFVTGFERMVSLLPSKHALYDPREEPSFNVQTSVLWHHQHSARKYPSLRDGSQIRIHIDKFKPENDTACVHSFIFAMKSWRGSRIWNGIEQAAQRNSSPSPEAADQERSPRRSSRFAIVLPLNDINVPLQDRDPIWDRNRFPRPLILPTAISCVTVTAKVQETVKEKKKLKSSRLCLQYRKGSPETSKRNSSWAKCFLITFIVNWTSLERILLQTHETQSEPVVLIYWSLGLLLQPFYIPSVRTRIETFVHFRLFTNMRME